MEIFVATGNPDKLREVSEIISFPGLEIISLADLGIRGPDETGLTLRENAQIKTHHGFRVSGIPAVSEDTGLFVDAIGGMPGVFSSRFAGPGATYQDNRQKLLSLLKGVPFEKRRACFTTVACFTRNGRDFIFTEARAEGFITRVEQGESGFGYDPVFLYPPMGRTFAELPPRVKNRISHRAKAFLVMKEILEREL